MRRRGSPAGRSTVMTLFALVAAATAVAQSPAPPADLSVRDRPWDKGEKIDLSWALSPDDAETIAAYRIYRSLTTKEAEQVDFEKRLDDLWDAFEDLSLPAEELNAAIEEFLPRLRRAAASDHAEHYDYEYQARRAVRALDKYLAAGMDDADRKRRAGKALKVLFKAIPLSDVQQQNKDWENEEERIAKMAETEPVLEALFGPGWNEVWEEQTDEIPTDVRQRLLADREAAEDEAERRVLDEIAALGDAVRFKVVIDVEPELLDERAGRMDYTVDKLDRFQDYLFQVVAVSRDGVESEPVAASAPVQPMRQVYDGSRLALMVLVFIICGSVILFIQIARTGRPLNVRKIAGLSAVEEAVGRATEMGRPILFICGIQDMNDIQTIAGITVLSRVAKLAAEYDARIEVPTSRSLVMTAARETVQSAYLAAGRPDSYNRDLIYYVTDEQFGFVAYLQGMMVREKPAACFYMGTFFAESLILAETGNSIGAIQVAGTAMPAQLPFFVAACDYTLIGEEFFAASAYLSGEPEQLGSLKGQDVGKVVVALMVIIGVIFATALSVATLKDNAVLAAHLEEIVDFIKKVILT